MDSLSPPASPLKSGLPSQPARAGAAPGRAAPAAPISAPIAASPRLEPRSLPTSPLRGPASPPSPPPISPGQKSRIHLKDRLPSLNRKRAASEEANTPRSAKSRRTEDRLSPTSSPESPRGLKEMIQSRLSSPRKQEKRLRGLALSPPRASNSALGPGRMANSIAGASEMRLSFPSRASHPATPPVPGGRSQSADPGKIRAAFSLADLFELELSPPSPAQSAVTLGDSLKQAGLAMASAYENALAHMRTMLEFQGRLQQAQSALQHLEWETAPDKRQAALASCRNEMSALGQEWRLYARAVSAHAAGLEALQPAFESAIAAVSGSAAEAGPQPVARLVRMDSSQFDKLIQELEQGTSSLNAPATQAARPGTATESANPVNPATPAAPRLPSQQRPRRLLPGGSGADYRSRPARLAGPGIAGRAGDAGGNSPLALDQLEKILDAEPASPVGRLPGTAGAERH